MNLISSSLQKKFSWNARLCAVQSSSYNHLDQMHFFLFLARQYNVILLKSTSFPLRSFRSSFIRLRCRTIFQWHFLCLNPVKPGNSHYQDILSVFTAYRRDARLEGLKLSLQPRPQGLLPTSRHFENRRGEGPGDKVGPASENWEWCEWCWVQNQAREKDSGWNPCLFLLPWQLSPPVAKATHSCQVINKHSTSLRTVCVNPSLKK